MLEGLKGKSATKSVRRVRDFQLLQIDPDGTWGLQQLQRKKRPAWRWSMLKLRKMFDKAFYFRLYNLRDCQRHCERVRTDTVHGRKRQCTYWILLCSWTIRRIRGIPKLNLNRQREARWWRDVDSLAQLAEQSFQASTSSSRLAGLYAFITPEPSIVQQNRSKQYRVALNWDQQHLDKAKDSLPNLWTCHGCHRCSQSITGAGGQ